MKSGGSRAADKPPTGSNGRGVPEVAWHRLMWRTAFHLNRRSPSHNFPPRPASSSTSFTMDTYRASIPSMGRAAADAADTLFGEDRGKRVGEPVPNHLRTAPRWTAGELHG